jgi:hypothetical protein
MARHRLEHNIFDSYNLTIFSIILNKKQMDITKINQNLKKKAISIKGKEYSKVADRIKEASESDLDYSISTDYEYIPDLKMFIVKATLTIEGNIYTGLSQVVVGSSSINTTSPLENCETSAVGRAFAMKGFGVLDSIASVDEIQKAQNTTVISPVIVISKEIRSLLKEQGFSEASVIETLKKKFNVESLERLSLRQLEEIRTKLIAKKKSTKTEYENLDEYIKSQEESKNSMS